jgi:FdhD protein
MKAVIVHHDGNRAERQDATIAVEEPLEIRLEDEALAVTMRTPGNDDDLATGFLLTEGIVLAPAEIARLERVGAGDESRLSARLAQGIQVDTRPFQRRTFVSSSCGICGKGAIENVRLLSRPLPRFTIGLDVIASLTGRLEAGQPGFLATGGLHAAGLFGLDGSPMSVREDVGRHNAVDKVIGAVARTAWPLPPAILVVSGRQSFEIIQKSAMAGIGGVVGVSAPSSLAVELAAETGMLLVGFARGNEFNIYAGQERVTT